MSIQVSPLSRPATNILATGIGRSTAIHFSRHGVAGLAIADINGDSIREVANSIANEFPRVRVLPFVLDVTDAAEVKRSLAQTVKELGRLDVAVNNAGALAKNQLTHTLPNEEWQRIINLNINSVFYCQKEELGDNEEARVRAPSSERPYRIYANSIYWVIGILVLDEVVVPSSTLRR